MRTTTTSTSTRRSVLRIAVAAIAIVATIVILYAANVALGMRAHARTTGSVAGLALFRPVEIIRDERGIPHLAAENEHDLFYAQGYAEGSDRLFQMDLLRRFIEGDLATVFGAKALQSDETERAIPVRAIAQAQWLALDASTRELLGAFSDGVNAAIDREPLPVEFRLLAYRPQPWTPQDTLAVGMVTVLDLTDDWNAIAPRDRAYQTGGNALLDARFPLTDPCYDAPVTTGFAGMGAGPACRSRAALLPSLADPRAALGSNEWAVGANRSLTRHALLANDPHLGLQIPGVWYLVDMHAPGFHAAGATLPGVPGVILGHNDRLAWGATSGTVTSLSVFNPPAQLDPHDWQTETFTIRFRRNVTKRFYRTAREFGVTTNDGRFVLVRWNFYTNPVSPVQPLLDLDRAPTMEAAITALARFPGPTQNFVLADTSGRAAYVLAGSIPHDPLWARRFHPTADLAKTYPPLPFTMLPHVAPSRGAVLWTANNKIYAAGYPWRLSAAFTPPYRAYRVAQLLRARQKYDVAYFTQMQLDVLSNPERDLAHALAPGLRALNPNLAAALASWDGEMRGNSTTATIAQRLRVALTDNWKERTPTLLATVPTPLILSEARKASAVEGPPQPWSNAGAAPVLHAFASLGVNFLNGATLPGNGDAFTIHAQAPNEGSSGYYSQSFRAVWNVGDWDTGGISLPEGESGEPGSGHYTDQAPAWLAGRLLPLPYSEAAVERAAVQREVLSR